MSTKKPGGKTPTGKQPAEKKPTPSADEFGGEDTPLPPLVPQDLEQDGMPARPTQVMSVAELGAAGITVSGEINPPREEIASELNFHERRTEPPLLQENPGATGNPQEEAPMHPTDKQLASPELKRPDSSHLEGEMLAFNVLGQAIAKARELTNLFDKDFFALSDESLNADLEIIKAAVEDRQYSMEDTQELRNLKMELELRINERNLQRNTVTNYKSVIDRVAMWCERSIEEYAELPDDQRRKKREEMVEIVTKIRSLRCLVSDEEILEAEKLGKKERMAEILRYGFSNKEICEAEELGHRLEQKEIELQQFIRDQAEKREQDAQEAAKAAKRSQILELLETLRRWETTEDLLEYDRSIPRQVRAKMKEEMGEVVQFLDNQPLDEDQKREITRAYKLFLQREEEVRQKIVSEPSTSSANESDVVDLSEEDLLAEVEEEAPPPAEEPIAAPTTGQFRATLDDIESVQEGDDALQPRRRRRITTPTVFAAVIDREQRFPTIPDMVIPDIDRGLLHQPRATLMFGAVPAPEAPPVAEPAPLPAITAEDEAREARLRDIKKAMREADDLLELALEDFRKQERAREWVHEVLSSALQDETLGLLDELKEEIIAKLKRLKSKMDEYVDSKNPVAARIRESLVEMLSALSAAKYLAEELKQATLDQSGAATSLGLATQAASENLKEQMEKLLRIERAYEEARGVVHDARDFLDRVLELKGDVQKSKEEIAEERRNLVEMASRLGESTRSLAEKVGKLSDQPAITKGNFDQMVEEARTAIAGGLTSFDENARNLLFQQSMDHHSETERLREAHHSEAQKLREVHLGQLTEHTKVLENIAAAFTAVADKYDLTKTTLAEIRSDQLEIASNRAEREVAAHLKSAQATEKLAGEIAGQTQEIQGLRRELGAHNPPVTPEELLNIASRAKDAADAAARIAGTAERNEAAMLARLTASDKAIATAADRLGSVVDPLKAEVTRLGTEIRNELAEVQTLCASLVEIVPGFRAVVEAVNAQTVAIKGMATHSLATDPTIPIVIHPAPEAAPKTEKEDNEMSTHKTGVIPEFLALAPLMSFLENFAKQTPEELAKLSPSQAGQLEQAKELLERMLGIYGAKRKHSASNSALDKATEEEVNKLLDTLEELLEKTKARQTTTVITKPRSLGGRIMGGLAVVAAVGILLLLVFVAGYSYYRFAGVVEPKAETKKVEKGVPARKLLENCDNATEDQLGDEDHFIWDCPENAPAKHNQDGGTWSVCECTRIEVSHKG